MLMLRAARLVSALALALTFASLGAGCVVRARNLGRGTRITEAGVATAPIKPPQAPSDEATAAQLQLAREQGNAADAALAWWSTHGAVTAGRMGAGEYQVSYTLRPLTGTWIPASEGGLAWQPEAGNVLLAVVVQDGADLRPVPGLKVGAVISDERGAPLASIALPFRWAVPVEEYAAPVTLPPGRVTIRVQIEPPGYWRHDPSNGDRFGAPVFAEFSHVPFDPAGIAPPRDESAEGSAALDLGRAQGAALGRAYIEMSRAVANNGTEMTVGDYRIAYAVEFAETFWQMSGQRLEYNMRPEQSAETNAHVEIAVLDALTGRFLPDLAVRVTVVDAAGRPVGTEAVPFMWHPWMYHYGHNWRVPRAGLYRLLVHVDPPRWPRAGHELGRRFIQPIDVTFDGVRIFTGQK